MATKITGITPITNRAFLRLVNANTTDLFFYERPTFRSPPHDVIAEPTETWQNQALEQPPVMSRSFPYRNEVKAKVGLVRRENCIRNMQPYEQKRKVAFVVRRGEWLYEYLHESAKA